MKKKHYANDTDHPTQSVKKLTKCIYKFKIQHALIFKIHIPPHKYDQIFLKSKKVKSFFSTKKKKIIALHIIDSKTDKTKISSSIKKLLLKSGKTPSKPKTKQMYLALLPYMLSSTSC